MTLGYKSPGIYSENIFVRSTAALPTGVPGFVGFGATQDDKPAQLLRVEDFDVYFTVAAGVSGYLRNAITGFFANGGERCYVIGAKTEGDKEQALKSALAKLAPVNDIDLVAIPDAMVLGENVEIQSVQREILKHCDVHGNCFAILDAPRVDETPAEINETLTRWREAISVGGTNLNNAAMYYPWIKIADGTVMPPSGHVAGIYARSDARTGVFKAPANEELIGVLDLDVLIDTAIQEQLNPMGINCLRMFPGRGLRVWGARTLSRDTNWRYVNVRRLFLTLMRWIDRNMTWIPFEPNTPRLWLRIQRELGTYLNKLWQAGALKGASVNEAYYVKCDAETNPKEEREQGRVTTEIGLAAALPAEFIIVRIAHRDGNTELVV